jgi:glycosyltransferase involved in cell wall biosynthesis
MRITLVSPFEEAVPPRAYGGIERVVHLLDRELVHRGHDVVLVASGGSASAGELVAITPKPLGRDLDAELKNHTARLAAAAVADLASDVVLNHWWRILDHLPVDSPPVLTTVHYPLDEDPYRSIFLARRDRPYVSISLSQQRAAPELNFAANIYNGIDVDTMPFRDACGEYLAFVGRFSPDKGADTAVRVARASGMPLKIAAKVDGIGRAWFESQVGPIETLDGVELLGELTSGECSELLVGALALLQPSRWSEPFGLAAVEAMACGTPVIALRRGATPEVIRHGETGLVVDREDEMTAAVELVPGLSRRSCRAHVEASFDYRVMVDGYVKEAEAALRA